MARSSQDEMDQLIAGYGGAAMVHSPAVRKVKIKNPNRGMGEGQDPFAEKELELDVQQWKGPNGALIEAYQLPDGSWEVEKNTPATTSGGTSTTNPAQATGGATSDITGTPTAYDAQGRPTAWDNSRPVRLWTNPSTGAVVKVEALNPDERKKWEREKNQTAGLGAKTDEEVERDKPKTGESRGPAEGYPGWTKITRKKVENGNETTVVTFLPPGKTAQADEVSSPPAQVKSDRKPVEGHPGLYVVSTTKDGATETHFENAEGQRVEAPPNLPASIKSGGITYIRQPDQSYAPAQGIPSPTAAEPEGAPKPSGRLGEAAADLRNYREWLNGQIRAKKITPEQADKLEAARLAFWKVALDEQQDIVNAQSNAHGQAISQRGQTLSDQNSRRSSATTISTSDPNGLTKLLGTFGSDPSSGAGIGRAIVQSRVNAQNFVTMSGANRVVPEVTPPPAVAQVNTMGLPGGAPQMNPGFNPRPGGWFTPNASAAPVPTGADVAAANAASQAAANAAFTRANPVFRPAPVTAPVQPAAATPAASSAPRSAPANAQTTVNAAAVPGTRGSTPTINGATGDATGIPQPSGTERPDDVLTVRGSDGRIVQISRSYWDENPAHQAGWTVVNAESGSLYVRDPATGQLVRRSAAPSNSNPATTDPNDPINQNPGGRVLPQPAPQPVAPSSNPSGPQSFAPGEVGQPQMMTQQQNPYFLAGSSNGRRYDPTPSIQAMIADPNLDNNVIREVVMEDYPGYPIDQLLGVA